jgi:hypothetical protein
VLRDFKKMFEVVKIVVILSLTTSLGISLVIIFVTRLAPNLGRKLRQTLTVLSVQ